MSSKAKSNKMVEILKKYNIYFILLFCIILCICVSPNFFTMTNLTNIGKQYAGITIISMGMLMVIMTGGIDLSVGSIVALGSVLVAQFMSNMGLGMFAGIILAVLSGAACGVISGFFVAKVKMPAFIVTMAMLTMAKGVAFIVSNGAPLKTPPGTLQMIGKSSFGPVPGLVVIAAVFVVLFALIQNYTAYGRIVKAIGSNGEAVRLSGIRVDRYLLSVYVISGALSALAGIVAASRTGTGTPLYGAGLELDAIASCVIGGASLSGGQGSAVKTVVGVLVLALIGNIMNLLSVPSYPQDVIKGIIILVSILLQILTTSKKA